MHVCDGPIVIGNIILLAIEINNKEKKIISHSLDISSCLDTICSCVNSLEGIKYDNVVENNWTVQMSITLMRIV